MENVSQHTLKGVILKYFKLFENKESFRTMKIVSSHHELGPRYPEEIEIEKLNDGGYEISIVFNEDFNHQQYRSIDEVKNFVDDIQGNITSISLSVSHKDKILRKNIFMNGILTVYAGDDCSDKNLIKRIELQTELGYKNYELGALKDCIRLLKYIKIKRTENERLEDKIKGLKTKELDEMNPLHEAMVQLAHRSNTLSFGKNKEIGYYEDLIIELLNGLNVDEYLSQRIFHESCNGVINLISSLERLNEYYDKILKILYKDLENDTFLEKMNINGNIFKIKEELLDAKMNVLNNEDGLMIAIKKLKKNHKKKSKEIKNVTGIIHATVPFSFGKSSKIRLIEADIVYLSGEF